MKMMIRSFLKFILVFLTATSCSKNIFQASASTDSDDSLLVDAKAAINAFNYQSAIDIITLQMTATGKAAVSAKEVLASAYAGKCGLNFVNYLDSLSHATTGTGFGLMMAPYVGIAADPDSCLLALNTLETIGTSANRTANENAFAAVVGMSLLGSQVRTAVDVTPTNGDGTLDSSVCAMTTAQIDKVILGFGHMIQNFSYLTVSQLGGSSQTAINGIISVCTSIPGITNCAITDPAQITQPLRDTMLDLLNTDDYGVGSVHTGGNPVAIVGACP